MICQHSDLIIRKSQFISFLYILFTTVRCSQGREYLDDFFNLDDLFIIDDDDFSPSSAPSISPTNFHTSYPTTYSTSLVTDTPSVSITDAPSTRHCQVSSSGFYGDNTLSHNMTSEYYRYEYQMEYKQNSDVNEILRDLEREISNSILASTSIFGECSSQRPRFLLRSKSTTRKASQNIIGLSSSPRDIITSGNCHEMILSDSACGVVKGILTLYYEGNQSRRLDAIDDISRAIEDGMGNGSLALSNDNIINLDYLGSNNGVGGKGSSEGRGTTSWGGLNPLHLSYMLLAACGLVPLMALVSIKFIQNKLRNSIEAEQRVRPRQFPINNVANDDSTNFISSLEESEEESFFNKWRASGANAINVK